MTYDDWNGMSDRDDRAEEHICQGAMCEHGICLCQICDACDEFNAAIRAEESADAE